MDVLPDECALQTCTVHWGPEEGDGSLGTEVNDNCEPSSRPSIRGADSKNGKCS